MDTKELRQKILDLAIRGKLVPQDPNDEPASVLLERIRAEKERLITEGKIKRPKKSKASSAESHYQKLPQGWTVTRLSDIAWFGGGKTPSTENKAYWENGTVNWITSKDMKEPVITDSKIKLSTLGASQNTLYPKGTLLMVTRSGILRRTLPLAVIVKESTVNQDIKTINTPFGEISEFLYWYFSALEKEILEKYQKDGTTVESIDFERFQDIEIFLPPLSEQKRIIDQLKTLLHLIDVMSSDSVQIKTTIEKAKSKILDLAMQGKLVPQDPTDELASDMLLRINPKAKIITDNPHYPQLPSGWCIAAIRDTFEINPKNKADGDKEAGFVPMASICDGFNNSFIYTPRKWDEIKNGFTHFANGDIAVAKISPCLENRKSMILRNLPNGIGCGTTELLVFRSKVIYPEYGLLFFKSDNFIKQCVGTFNGVVGQQRVSKNIVEEIHFPIPPYKAQIQIANVVNRLFKTLDQINSNLVN